MSTHGDAAGEEMPCACSGELDLTSGGGKNNSR